MWPLSEDSLELAAVLSAFLEQDEHSEVARTNLENRNIPLSSVWSGFVDSLGLAGLVLPEAAGGGGGSLLDAVVAQFVWGRSGASAPVLSHLLSAEALRRLPADTRSEALFDDLVGGAVITIAPRPVSKIEATMDMDGNYVLSGEVASVVDASMAQTAVLMLPDGDDEVTVVTVDITQPQTSITPRVSWTGTRSYGDIRLERALARTVGKGSACYAAGVLAVARILLAAERIGGAFACLDRSVEYARTRVQFDRPIGLFQGVKHPLAEVFVQVQMAQSQLRKALVEVEHSTGAAPESALLAGICCDRAFRHASEQDIEVHGGMGYTWENDSHLFYRRSRSDAGFTGSAADDLQSLLTNFQKGT